ncbi:SPOR domain-containing protein [Marinobacter sp. C2H3]|uniref:SPOR domain-containing protein n=1 Tax=Marinobacter sp. C2H3 TaxID=3119003 RepID=UPI00300F51AB
MAQDYARKSRSGRAAATPRRDTTSRRPTPQRSASRSRASAPVNNQRGGLSLKWIVALAAVGGFIGFIVYLNSLPVTPAPTRATASAPETQPAPTTADDKKPTFRFYDMLPESEVVPPQVEEYSPPKTFTQYDYIVQSGSFRDRADAERQRAQIAFQGLRASIQRIETDSGSVWFRVNVGPFSDRSKMNAAVDKLVTLSISPLVRKIPKEG